MDERYWLAHCEGYRVECPGGRVGTVLEVSKDRLEQQAERLIVGSGLLRRQLIAVDPREVAEVSPHRLRIRLHRPPLELSSEPFARAARSRRRRAIGSIAAPR